MDNINSRFSRKWFGMSLVATTMTLTLLFVMTINAFAGTVNINDQANVLNRSQIQSAASSLSYPLNIYTTNTFNGTAADFDQRARGHLTSTNMIVIAIDTVNKHVAIVG